MIGELEGTPGIRDWVVVVSGSVMSSMGFFVKVTGMSDLVSAGEGG